MNRQHRMKLFDIQSRAYTEGTIEVINEQWIFFDGETEEATPLEEYYNQEIEVFRINRWKKGVLFESGKVCGANETFFLHNKDLVRIRKHLVYSLERLLEEVTDEAFIQFVTTLNALNFSVFDCLYCYNHLSFLTDESRKNGVNFMIFDNQDQICNVQHHFCHFEKTNDRFEFTLNTGKRLVIEKLIL